MNYLTRHNHWTVTAALLMFILVQDVTPNDPRESIYYRSPDLRSLMEWVTFYQSFDHESFVPDMAAGQWKPKLFGKPELAPGLLGRALVAGTGSVLYPSDKNWIIDTRGAASLWVCPVKWDHENAGNTNFIISSTAALYLERQGPLRKPDGQWRRLEALLFGLQRGPKGNVSAGCKQWKDGEWHLLVINWSWPMLEMSVDGGAFRAKELNEKPPARFFGDLMIGSKGGDHTLIDEVFCYRRPLTENEAKRIYEISAPQIENPRR